MADWCARVGLPQGAWMTLDRCWEMARRWYSGRADESWRGRTPEAAQAIFQEVGLTGEFWRMV